MATNNKASREGGNIVSAEATPEMIDGWKKKYGDVFEITVEDKKCYLHKPRRAHISAAATLAQGDNIKNSEILLNNCWLAGSGRGDQDGRLVLLRRALDPVGTDHRPHGRAKKL